MLLNGDPVSALGIAAKQYTDGRTRGQIGGLTLSTAGSSATFSVAAGSAVNSTNADYIALASTLSKTTATWAVGNGNGGLDTGTIAASTWYHAYVIKRVDTGVVDVLVSLSATAPTMPGSYTLFRRIGAMLTNGSSQWTKFVQTGDEFVGRAARRRCRRCRGSIRCVADRICAAQC